MLYQPVSQWHSLHLELLIELVAQKLTELWWFKKLAYFLTWWPSSMTYLFVNVTYWNCSPIPYVDQVWWWYVKAFMSYAWQNWQTNRQTPQQTNILAKNCKFWQVTNRQTNILAKICKFWQVTIIIWEGLYWQGKHKRQAPFYYHWMYWDLSVWPPLVMKKQLPQWMLMWYLPLITYNSKINHKYITW